jgi:site-specific DNA recombinase
MRAAIYLRNSDGRQAVAGTHEGQLAAAEVRAKQLGADVVGLYSDEGKSAKTGQLKRRGDFARLVVDARAGRLDVVIVANIDRLTRTESFAELGAIYGPLQDAGVKVATTSGQILDLNAPDGQLLAMFEAWRASRENAARRERTLRGRARTAAAGRPPGRAPWGLRYVVGEGWQHTDAAFRVKEMFERVARGESTEAIAADLYHRGVEPPGKDYRRGKPVQWRRSTVYDLLVREVYRGKWRANGNIVVTVPAIVDDTLWTAAQEALLVAKRRGLRRTRHVYLLEGIARCALCQGRINIRTSTDASCAIAYRYYYCVNRYRGAYGERCALPLMRVEHVDARVWAAVSKFVSRPDLVAEAVARQYGAAGDDAKRAASDLDGWKRQLARLVELESDTLALCRRGVLGREARDGELLKIAQQRRMLEQQIEAAREMAASVITERESASEIAAWLGTLRDRLKDATVEVRREIVRALVPGRGGFCFTVGREKLVGHALLGNGATKVSAVELLVA